MPRPTGVSGRHRRIGAAVLTTMLAASWFATSAIAGVGQVAEAPVHADLPGDATGAVEERAAVAVGAELATTDDATGDLPDPASVEPLSVPVATGNTAVITVRTGGIRTGGSAVAGLEGMTLRLHNGDSGPSTPVNAAWASCESDADGDCSFVVPETQPKVTRCVIPRFLGCYREETIQEAGANHNARFWVVADHAPDGWYTNPTLVTGAATSQQSTRYQFRTGSELVAGKTYSSRNHFMAAGGDATRNGSSGTWQVSRDNPALPETCDAGIDVALVLDLSGSVSNAGAVGSLRSSAIAFAEALEGTNSRLALYTFAASAPRSASANGRNYAPMPIDGNLKTIRSRINDYTASGGTNWDRGIWQVADGPRYDLAIVVTDGLATFSGSGTGPGDFTRFRETEQAIFSANALKEEGTRVLAVGVGSGIGRHADNLRAVSGPTSYGRGTSANSADYFQTGWRELAPLLESLAAGATCQSTITVDKVVEPYGAAEGSGAGWTFEAAVEAGDGVLVGDAEKTTGTTGVVEYTVQFDAPDAAAATVRLGERMSQAQAAVGWQLDSISCTVNGAPRDLARSGSSVAIAGLVPGDDAACTFTNVQTRVPGISVVKRAWDAVSAAVLDEAQEILAGGPITADRTITWTYDVTNTGQTRLTGITVLDDQAGAASCPASTLAPGDAMRCTASGRVTALQPVGP